MVNLNKKGYLQTLEAVIALMIIFGVIIFSISLREPPKQEVPEDIRLTQEAVIGGVQYDQVMRDYIFEGTAGSLSAIGMYAGILTSVPGGIGAGFGINDFIFPHNLHANKPNVYADSIILANSNGSVRTFSLFLWYLDEELANPCPVSAVGGMAPCVNDMNCIQELEIIIGNTTILEQVLDSSHFFCDSGVCSMRSYTC